MFYGKKISDCNFYSEEKTERENKYVVQKTCLKENEWKLP